jgi:hypothetical protein
LIWVTNSKHLTHNNQGNKHMKNINLRAVGVAALSTVAFSIGAVLPAMAQTAPTPPTAPTPVTPVTPPTSVRTDILIPTPPTAPRPPAFNATQIRTLLGQINAAARAGNTAEFNRLRTVAISVLAARGVFQR